MRGIQMGDNTGKPYEKLARVVFELIVNQSDVRNIVVQHDVTLQGKFNNSHQIDVYWKFAVDRLEYETVLEAKDWKNPVDQGELFKFKTVLDDLPGQPKGIFVSRTGYQQGAIDFALAHGILLYELREADYPPALGITPGGWATFKLVSMPLHGLLTNGEPDIDASSAIALGLDQEVFTPHFSDITFDVSKSWLEREYPDEDISQIKTFKPVEGPFWHEILLYNDRGKVVGNLGTVFGKITEVMKNEGVEKKRVTQVLEEPASIRTVSLNVPWIKITAVSADVEIKRSHALLRTKMSNFTELVLHQLNSNQTMWFAATPSVIVQITGA